MIKTKRYSGFRCLVGKDDFSTIMFKDRRPDSNLNDLVTVDITKSYLPFRSTDTRKAIFFRSSKDRFKKNPPYTLLSIFKEYNIDYPHESFLVCQLMRL